MAKITFTPKPKTGPEVTGIPWKWSPEKGFYKESFPGSFSFHGFKRFH